MRIIYLSLWLAGSFLFYTCRGSKGNQSDPVSTQKLTVTVMYTSEYCGGAYPSDRILKAEKKARAYSDQDLFILQKGWTEEKRLMFHTSSEGRFDASLPQGEYLLFMPEKISTQFTGGAMGKETCEKWKATPNGTLIIDHGDTTPEVTIHKTCNRCLEPMR